MNTFLTTGKNKRIAGQKHACETLGLSTDGIAEVLRRRLVNYAEGDDAKDQRVRSIISSYLEGVVSDDSEPTSSTQSQGANSFRGRKESSGNESSFDDQREEEDGPNDHHDDTDDSTKTSLSIDPVDVVLIDLTLTKSGVFTIVSLTQDGFPNGFIQRQGSSSCLFHKKVTDIKLSNSFVSQPKNE